MSAADHPWDPGLQPERTTLAWERTGLAMFGCSLALAAIDKQVVHLNWLLPTLGVLAFAIWIMGTARFRYRRVHHALTVDEGRLPGGALLVLTSAAGLVLAVVGVATWIAHQ